MCNSPEIYKDYLVVSGRRWFRRLLSYPGGRPGLFQVMRITERRVEDGFLVCLAPDRDSGKDDDSGHRAPGSIGRLFSIFDASNYMTSEMRHRCKSPHDDFLEHQQLFRPDKRCFFEIALGYVQQKPHFDIDVSVDKLTQEGFSDITTDELPLIGRHVLEAVMEACEAVLLARRDIRLVPERNFLVYSSNASNGTKVSYHLLIGGYKHVGNESAKAFYENVRAYLGNVSTHPGKVYAALVDPCVYSSKQQFRLLGSQKAGSGRVKIFVQRFMYKDEEYIHAPSAMSTFRESLLTYTRNCVDIGDLSMYLPPRRVPGASFEISDACADRAMKLLEDAMPDTFTFRCVVGNVVYVTKKGPYYCPVCDREHPHENPKLVITDGKVLYRCRRPPYGSLSLGCLDGRERYFYSYSDVENRSREGRQFPCVTDDAPVELPGVRQEENINTAKNRQHAALCDVATRFPNGMSFPVTAHPVVLSPPPVIALATPKMTPPPHKVDDTHVWTGSTMRKAWSPFRRRTNI